MSELNPARGELEVDLGSLGRVVCRPGFRALQAIDDPKRNGPLTAIIQRLFSSPSLNDVVTIIYETHLDAQPEKRFRYDEIGEAVLEVGMDTLYIQCAELVGTAWSKRAEKESEKETSSGNAQGALNQTADSPPKSMRH